MDPADAAEAKYHMDGQVLMGREVTVVFAEENRKKPTDMRARERGRYTFFFPFSIFIYYAASVSCFPNVVGSDRGPRD